MEKAEMKDKLYRYMNETFLLEFNDSVSEDTDLFKAGILDSFGYLRLLTYIENEFQIKFTEDEILANVFTSFSDLVQCISGKL
ncbi:acyl carrier protein [Gorillibacterium sp. sgz500922]|uniref:acyl carrier protein n=1 Tax=Gorillibacterium sp. sgz500922 TaxID=3446694 RepID=UPI003F674717